MLRQLYMLQWQERFLQMKRLREQMQEIIIIIIIIIIILFNDELELSQ
jgi:hypothetical protein